MNQVARFFFCFNETSQNSVTSVKRFVVIHHACCLFRLAHLVQLAPSAQTLQPRPLNALKGLTVWGLQPVA